MSYFTLWFPLLKFTDVNLIYRHECMLLHPVKFKENKMVDISGDTDFLKGSREGGVCSFWQ